MTAPTPHRAAVEAAARAVYDALKLADNEAFFSDFQVNSAFGPEMEVIGKATSVDGQFDLEIVARAAIRAYLAAMEAAGWRMVPAKPTETMLERAVLNDPRWTISTLPRIRRAWEGMCDAAPPPEGG